MGITGDITFRESSGKLYVKWTIKYCSNLFKKNLPLKSPYFSLCNSVWYFNLDQISTVLFMRLCKVDSLVAYNRGIATRIETNSGFPITYSMGVKSHHGYETVTCNYEFPIRKKAFYAGDWCAFDENFNSRKFSENVDSDGFVTVFCKFHLNPCSYDKESPSQDPLNGGPSLSKRSGDLYPSKSTMTVSEGLKDMYLSKSTMTLSEDFGDLCLDKGAANLSDNFKELFLSQSFTDVTIKIKNKEFHVHKIVLVARSTVFASMFKHEMAEKSSGVVEITDCDADSFEDFLLFLYSGKLSIVTDSNAVKLYETADKYDIQELKDECVRCMTEKMTVDSFCDVVCLAVVYNEAELLSTATQFFINNLGSILTTTKWQTFLEENPSMGNELFLKTVKIQDN